MESGYIGEIDAAEYVGSEMTDVVVFRVSGVNFIARGRRYGRQWLLKGLRDDLRGSSVMRRRLLKEFEIHSRLSHSGIVQAIGLEEIPGLGLCIVEEWIEGKSLAELLLEGSLSKTERRRILRDIVGVVGYLHSKGIVHRDIKPANVMAREGGGEVVIIDFGLADTGDYVELKQAAGTAGFISPEQMEQGGARPTDDIYSLGVLMQELCPEYAAIARRCTGPVDRRPKDAHDLLNVIERRIRRPKRIVLSLTVSVIVAIAAIGVWRIATLGNVADEAKRKVAVLSAESARNAAHTVRLEDSLCLVRARMTAAETEIRKKEEYVNQLNNVRQEGYGKIDRLLGKYDKEFSQMTSENRLEFSDGQTRLHNEMRQVTDEYCASDAVARLEKADRERMWMEMYEHFTAKFAKLHERWMQKIYP